MAKQLFGSPICDQQETHQVCHCLAGIWRHGAVLLAIAVWQFQPELAQHDCQWAARHAMTNSEWRIQPTCQRLLYLQVQVWGVEWPLHANVRDLIE